MSGIRLTCLGAGLDAFVENGAAGEKPLAVDAGLFILVIMQSQVLQVNGRTAPLFYNHLE